MILRPFLTLCCLLTFREGLQAQTPLPMDLARLEQAAPVQHMVYDFTKRQVVDSAAPEKNAITTFCYVNTDTSGFYTTVSEGRELLDWGILGGTASTKCAGLSPIVTELAFAYGTESLDPSLGGPGASLTLASTADLRRRRRFRVILR